MTKQQNLHFSLFFLLSSLIFLGFLINAMLTQTGLSRLISCLLFAGLINFQLRVALLMYREYRDKNLR